MVTSHLKIPLLQLNQVTEVEGCLLNRMFVSNQKNGNWQVR